MSRIRILDTILAWERRLPAGTYTANIGSRILETDCIVLKPMPAGSRRSQAKAVAILICLASNSLPAQAQQDIKDKSGNSFMTEDVPADKQSSNQQINTEGGSLFMEEVPQKQKAKRPAPKPEIDFSSLGVPVDPKGRIVPLIQPGSGPVLPNYSRLEMEYTPRTVYIPYSTYNGPYPYNPRSYYPRSPYSPWSYPYANQPLAQPFYPAPIGPYAPGYSIPLPQPQYTGIFALPLGVPRYYTSSTFDAPEDQQSNFQFSGSYWNGWPSASIWSPGWRSPFRGSLYVPTITQFQQQGSIRSIFPKSLDSSDQ